VRKLNRDDAAIGTFVAVLIMGIYWANRPHTEPELPCDKPSWHAYDAAYHESYDNLFLPDTSTITYDAGFGTFPQSSACKFRIDGHRQGARSNGVRHG
jgi:hypothetical protein